MVMLPALRPSRRRAERFADALDGRPTGDDQQLAALVQLAEALQRVPAGPAPDFTRQLRQRLVAVAAVTTPEAPPARARARVPANRLRLATAGIAVVTLLSAVSVGASSSLPGNPLYRLKRAAEAAQLAVAGSDYQRGVRELEFANTRLHEVAALTGRHDLAAGRATPGQRAADFDLAAASTPTGSAVGAGAPSGRIVSTLADMQSETARGARYLARDFEQHHHAASLTTLHRFTVRQYDGLRALLPSLPTAAVPTARQSLGQLTGIDRIVYPVLQHDRLCSGGCPAPLPGVPSGSGGSGAAGTGGQGGGIGSGLGTPPTGGGATSGPGGQGSAPGSTAPTGSPAPSPSSTDPLGGLLSATPSPSTGTGSQQPLPLPTSSLPLPLPLPTSTLPLPLPTSTLPLPGGGSSSGPSTTTAPSAGTTVCLPPLVLVGGICVSVPPLVP